MRERYHREYMGVRVYRAAVSAECRQHDLVCGGSAVLFWCLPTAALFLSMPMGDHRWWIWCPALVVMGAACLANIARCGRVHCYVTGPLFLIGAALSALRGTHLVSVSWNWIIGGVLIGSAGGCLLELFLGSYAAGLRQAPSKGEVSSLPPAT